MWPSQEFRRWAFDPFPAFDPLTGFRRMQREMSRALSELPAIAPGNFPPVNLWLGENSIVVTAELPGLTTDDVDITLNQDALTLRGERHPSAEENAGWHRRERSYGRFSRAVRLPFRVDPDRVQARFTDGILEIELVRPDADRPKKITVHAG